MGMDVEGSVRVLILSYYNSICLEGLRKTSKNLSVRIASLLAEI
jgi:hypothetical protein